MLALSPRVAANLIKYEIKGKKIILNIFLFE